MGKLANKRTTKSTPALRKTLRKRSNGSLTKPYDAKKYAGSVPGLAVLNDRKSAIMERIDAVQDDATLKALERTLDGASHYVLSDEQMAELEASHDRFLRGEAKLFTSAQMISRVRKAVRG